MTFPSLSFILVFLVAMGALTEAEADLLTDKLSAEKVPQGGWRAIKQEMEQVIGRKL